MGHDGVASGYPTPTGFRRLTVCQWDPRDRGVSKISTNIYVKSKYQYIPRNRYFILAIDHISLAVFIFYF